MFYYLFNCIVSTSFLEYGIHYMYHKLNIDMHLAHHKDYQNNTIEFEYYFIPISLLFYYYEYYILTFGSIKYLILHTMIHNKPEYLPSYIVNHHISHHSKYPNNNFSVSLPFIDTLFDTRYIEKNNI